MDEKFLQNVFKEIIQAQGDALGIVVAALAKQLDPARLTKDLQAQIAAATASKLLSPIAIEIATSARAAAEAEILLRKTNMH